MSTMDHNWTQFKKFKLNHLCSWSKLSIPKTNFSRMRRIKYGREFIVSPNRYLTEDIKNAINVLLTQVTSLNMKPLKNTGSFLNNEILRLFSDLKHIQCYHAALDSTESGIFKPDPSKIKRKTPKNVTISEKAIEKIKLRVIFNGTNF